VPETASRALKFGDIALGEILLLRCTHPVVGCPTSRFWDVGISPVL